MSSVTQKDETVLVNFYLPTVLLPIVRAAVKKEDTDRSKFIRNAIREKLQRSGVKLPEDADPNHTLKNTK